MRHEAMITASVGANLIGNMIQATKEVGVVWDSLLDEERDAIVTAWVDDLTNKQGSAAEVARMLVAKLNLLAGFEQAWLRIDPSVRDQQLGLISEVVSNVE